MAYSFYRRKTPASQNKIRLHLAVAGTSVSFCGRSLAGLRKTKRADGLAICSDCEIARRIREAGVDPRDGKIAVSVTLTESEIAGLIPLARAMIDSHRGSILAMNPIDRLFVQVVSGFEIEIHVRRSGTPSPTAHPFAVEK